MQTTFLRPLSVLFLTSLLALATIGCETTSAASQSRSTTQSGKPKIRIGMSSADVKEVMGDPAQSLPLESLGENGTEWQYKLFLTAYVGAKPVEMVRTPYIDPITGEQREILDPIYRPEHKDVRRLLHIYFLEDEVVGWTVEDYSSLRYD